MGTPQERNQGLAERESERNANTLDRRKISDNTRKELANAIDAGNTDLAFKIIFEVLTGEAQTDYKEGGT
jgi:hypothetical protein